MGLVESERKLHDKKELQIFIYWRAWRTTEETWGYCVFGRVIEGMDVVDSIRRVPTRDRGTRESVPVDAIVIDTAYVATDESEWADTTAAEEGGGGA